MHFDEFLKEATPLFGLQWRPFKRRGIRRKIERRMAQIGLLGYEEYLLRVKTDPTEKIYLSKILTITISRFFRDKEVFQTIETSLLPAILKKGERNLNIWSIGCASGEEPYTLFILWKEKFERFWPHLQISILATDLNEDLLKRAKEGRYRLSSLKEVPQGILSRYFKKDNGLYAIAPAIKQGVKFLKHDLINEDPFYEMDLVLCRNLAFTYFLKKCQEEVLKKIALSLKGGGYLVIGKDESLPLLYPTLFVLSFREGIFKKI